MRVSDTQNRRSSRCRPRSSFHQNEGHSPARRRGGEQKARFSGDTAACPFFTERRDARKAEYPNAVVVAVLLFARGTCTRQAAIMAKNRVVCSQKCSSARSSRQQLRVSRGTAQPQHSNDARRTQETPCTASSTEEAPVEGTIWSFQIGTSRIAHVHSNVRRMEPPSHHAFNHRNNRTAHVEKKPSCYMVKMGGRPRRGRGTSCINQPPDSRRQTSFGTEVTEDTGSQRRYQEGRIHRIRA